MFSLNYTAESKDYTDPISYSSSFVIKTVSQQSKQPIRFSQPLDIHEIMFFKTLFYSLSIFESFAYTLESLVIMLVQLHSLLQCNTGSLR